MKFVVKRKMSLEFLQSETEVVNAEISELVKNAIESANENGIVTPSIETIGIEFVQTVEPLYDDVYSSDFFKNLISVIITIYTK